MPADDRSLFLRHTCRENLLFHGRLHGLKGKPLGSVVEETLDRVGLIASIDHAGFALSSGMRARLQLARAILHRPPLLVLDEPTSSVDPVGARELLALIQGIARSDGIAVLISSHRVEEIEALKDNVLFLDKGRMLHHGPLDHWRHFYGTPRLHFRFTSPIAAAAAALVLSQHHDATYVDGSTEVHLVTEKQLGHLLMTLRQQLSDLEFVGQSRPSLPDLLAAASVSEATSKQSGGARA
jgi:ABC-2 type transport system ATP-binding protein